MFSLLIANFNNGKYLEECVNSIIIQKFQNFEIVIVDDCSTDDSIKIILQLKDLYPNIRLYQNKINSGCGFTKRRLCELANGEILAFVDPDDTISEYALQKMFEAHIEYPNYSLIYSTLFYCNSQLQPKYLSPYVQEIPVGQTLLTFKEGCISHFATFKKKYYNMTEGIDPSLIRAVDQDLYYKLEEVAPVKFINIPLYYYRIHEQGISTGQNEKKAYIWHLKVKINAYNRRGEKIMKFKSLAILAKLKNDFFNLFRYSICYFICKFYEG